MNMSYQNLEVWKLGMDLVEGVYGIIKLLPRQELFCLAAQLQRAVVSVPSNIAEGYGRNNTNEFRHFLRIAMGSRAEVQTQLLICVRLRYVTQEQIEPLLQLNEMLGRKLYNCIQSLQ